MKRAKMHRILVTARGLIGEEERWIKQAATDGAGNFCLLGAIRYAAQGNADTECRAEDKFEKIIGKCIEYSGIKRVGSMSVFNDRGRTKHKDVLRVLDCAIDRTKKGKK